MDDQKIRALHELRGQLVAKRVSIDDEIDTLSLLRDCVETSFYKGHVSGQIDTLKRIQRDLGRYLDGVFKLLREEENA